MSIVQNQSKSLVNQLSPDLRDWVDSQNLSRLGTMSRFACHEYATNELKVPVTQSAISRAIDSRELPATGLGNSLLVSEYDLVCWMLSRRNSEPRQRVSA